MSKYKKDHYTTIKMRRELGDLLDQWAEKHHEKLAPMGLDSRSGAVQYILYSILKSEGFVEEIPVGNV